MENVTGLKCNTEDMDVTYSLLYARGRGAFLSAVKLDWKVQWSVRKWGQTLSRSYGRCIAEFLSEGSLVSLSLLDSSTCVGLRYGRIISHVHLLF